LIHNLTSLIFLNSLASNPVKSITYLNNHRIIPLVIHSLIQSCKSVSLVQNVSAPQLIGFGN
ncbi:hypothetical protein, partial [Vibrio anguillarum]